ncbi:hypothetical protein GOEFS_070_00220 [Gordonia effusa NBRC 100432]|uniref:Alkaline shock response membrane anchor protein AmaP n=1 Tax=Gordonia effusa NBRC 100432 TaxID=1077974 RepID=H0R1I7_9ACTN|nr:hypothetical protein [Gordonia effusa]GAB18938.1 hypothetical protein GOEFS_070_00220 [Gordonia effusa NBRC 100432]
MNRLPATVHRLVVFVLAVGAIVVGGGALAWRLNLSPIKGWIERIDTGAVVRFADGSWWTAVLFGIVVLAVILAVILLATVVRPMKAQRLVLPASSSTGDLTVEPGLIANAAANDLASKPIILAAKGRAINDRGRLVIRLTVRAYSTRPFADLAKVCSDATDAITDALDGAPVQTQVLLQLEHPDPQKPAVAA